jgi:glutamine synthetase adenylyltransferase
MALLLAYGRFGANCRVKGHSEFRQQVSQMMAAWPDRDALQQEVAKMREKALSAPSGHAHRLSDIQQQHESD